MDFLKQEYKEVDILSISPHEKNVNQGDQGAIFESMQQNGFYGNLLVSKKTNKILAGKHRWLNLVKEGAKKVPVLLIDNLTEEQEIKIMLADNRTNRLGMDSGEELFKLLLELQENETGLAGTGYSDDDLQLLAEDLTLTYQDVQNINTPSQNDSNAQAGQSKSGTAQNSANPKVNRLELRVQEDEDDSQSYIDAMNQAALNVNESAFTSENDWGILDLDLNYQALEIKEPLQVWGSKKTVNQKIGYHFYTDDYRYTALFKDPSPLTNSGCTVIIEPNFGIIDLFPRAVVLYRVYQKRWIMRNCQKHGIRVAVNLDMPIQFMDLNFIGVPKGWQSYCVNGAIVNTDLLYQYHELAKSNAGREDIIYHVFGGGRKVAEICKDNEWVWIPESAEPNKKLQKKK